MGCSCNCGWLSCYRQHPFIEVRLQTPVKCGHPIAFSVELGQNNDVKRWLMVNVVPRFHDALDSPDPHLISDLMLDLLVNREPDEIG